MLLLDSGAGCTVGSVCLVLCPWLSGIYGFDPSLVLFIGAVNVIYGLSSGALLLLTTQRQDIPVAPLRFLALANASWVIPCGVLLTMTWSEATWLGVLHIILEATFVSWLALIELRIAGSLQFRER